MKYKTYITKSAEQTQKLGKKLAEKVLRLQTKNVAITLGLSGNLGGGKTTFLQGLAKGLGIKEKILSPTFVIQKRFVIKNKKFNNFYHIDCYRLKTAKDILELGLDETTKNPKNIIAIEWPEKIKNILPKSTILIKFKLINEQTRELTFNK